MSKSGKYTIVSLGMSCQTTHQLRRLISHSTEPPVQLDHALSRMHVLTGLFDWLICPPKSIISLLNDGIPDFDRKDIRLHKERPYWSNYDLYFWHNFTVKNNQQRQINIDEAFKNELKRWSKLRTRFSNLIPLETVFVLSNTQNNLASEVFDDDESDQYQFTAATIDALEHSLAAYFNAPVNQIHVEVVTRENRSSNLENKNRVTFLPEDQNQWKGSKQLWDQWSDNVLKRLTTR